MYKQNPVEFSIPEFDGTSKNAMSPASLSNRYCLTEEGFPPSPIGPHLYLCFLINFSLSLFYCTTTYFHFYVACIKKVLDAVVSRKIASADGKYHFSCGCGMVGVNNHLSISNEGKS